MIISEEKNDVQPVCPHCKKELVRVWYSERNFLRRDRAVDLAARLGASPINVALAYVLAQPFPVVPLIGPRTRDELEDSLKALAIALCL